MVNVQSIDIGAVLEQKLRNFNRRRKVKWSLPVTTASVDEGRIGREHILQYLEHSQAGCRVDVDHRPAPDQERSESVIVI